MSLFILSTPKAQKSKLATSMSADVRKELFGSSEEMASVICQNFMNKMNGLFRC